MNAKLISTTKDGREKYKDPEGKTHKAQSFNF